MRMLKDSGFKWIGKIPLNWNIKKLKYLSDSIGDGLHGTPLFSKGEIFFINSNNIGNKFLTLKADTDTLSENEFQKYKQKKLNDNSILISLNGTYGNTSFYNGEKILLGKSAGFINLNSSQNKTFIRYYLSSLCCKIEEDLSLNGTTISNLSLKTLKNLHIIFPSNNEQEQIVSYLDIKCNYIDEAINNHKIIIEKIEDYKRAFTISSVIGIRHNRVLQSSNIVWMPKVPKDWGIVPLRYVFGERKNKNIGMIEKNLLTLSYGKIKRKDINTNEGLLPESFEGYNIVEKGDIVLRLLDLQNDWNSLRTGLVTERGIVTSAYVTLYPLKKLNSEFFRYLLHSYDLKKVFYTMGEGIRQSLKYDDIARGLLLPIPSMEEQEEIVNAIKEVEAKADASIVRHQQIIEKLEEYRKSIIYNAVTGKIDCKGVAK